MTGKLSSLYLPLPLCLSPLTSHELAKQLTCPDSMLANRNARQVRLGTMHTLSCRGVGEREQGRGHCTCALNDNKRCCALPLAVAGFMRLHKPDSATLAPCSCAPCSCPLAVRASFSSDSLNVHLSLGHIKRCPAARVSHR